LKFFDVLDVQYRQQTLPFVLNKLIMEPTLVFSISTHQLSFPVPYSTFKAAAHTPVIATLLCAKY